MFPLTRAGTGLSITKACLHDMSPPPLSPVGDVPPPRRKSCLACVKAKRRCDQRAPSCFRCSQRKITCTYPHPARTRSVRGLQSHPTPEPSRPAIYSAVEQSHGEHELFEDISFDHDLLLQADASALQHQPGWLDDQAHFAPPHDAFSCGQHAEEAASPLPQKWSMMAPTVDVSLFGDAAGRSTFSSHTTSAHMTTRQTMPSYEIALTGYFNVDAINAELESKLAYAVEKIKSAPKTMLTALQTPWCHPSLYKDDMPLAMQG